MSGLLLTFYGDDFTGSTDALEALAAGGVPAVLFLEPPDQAALAGFPDCRAVGVAGVSRSQTPEWMSEHLPAVFGRLKALDAPICHYKVCSTFDSSPAIGSIGRALEIGQDVFGNACVPVVVGVPALGRYVLFGHLFARAGGEVYRIDRHPTMSCHPVTPMTESDLRLHLARQTGRKIGSLDIVSIRQGNARTKWDELVREGCRVAIFDGLDEDTLAETGRLLCDLSRSTQLFAVGSSGLEYALVACWRATRHLSPPVFTDPGPVERLIVVSGSCSPVTEGQIRWALANGFAGLRVHPDSDLENVRTRALEFLREGRSVVLYTALGPADRRFDMEGERMATRLGELLRELMESARVRRAVLAGGDTSGHAARHLGLQALTLLRPLDPGAPLCRAHAPGSWLDGAELVFKGGQIGRPDFFEAVRRGRR